MWLKVTVQNQLLHRKRCKQSKARQSKMKLFVSVRKFYEYMGVYPSQSQQKFPFNWRNLLVILSLIGFFTSMACSFLFKANTIIEHAESFYMTITALACLINYITSFWKTKDIYMFVEKLAKFNEARESIFYYRIF